MADATYLPGVYRTSGGDQMDVVSSGRIAVDSGGKVDVLSGGRLDIGGTAFITSGALIDLSSARNWISSGVYVSNGYIYGIHGYQKFVESLTSSAATIGGYGISIVTAATAVTLPLAAPVANVEKWIKVISTAATVTITSTAAGASLGGSTSAAITTGTLIAPSWLHLIGQNSTNWHVLGVSANVTIS